MGPAASREMRNINRTLILEYMRQRGKVSRSAIARDLELSLSSVVRITDELMEDRLIHLQGEHEYSGGRRRPLIELDTRRNAVVSLSLGGKRAAACLLDITGNILKSRSVDHQLRGEDCIALLRGLADEMLAQAGDKIVRGISIGVPGIVLEGNRVMAAPAVGLDNFCLADCLAPHYSAPVLVENDVNLAALGEMWFGYGKTCSNLIYIHIGTLIGMGIVLDRCIFRGAHHSAGELGYMIFSREELARDYPQYGALEASLSGYGLARSAQKYAPPGREIAPQEVFRLAGEGVAWAVELIEEFQQKLAMVLVAIATLFDPEVIVLGGGVMESAGQYLESIRARLAQKTPNPIRVERSQLGRDARILGGCTSILHHVMHYSLLKGTL